MKKKEGLFLLIFLMLSACIPNSRHNQPSPEMDTPPPASLTSPALFSTTAAALTINATSTPTRPLIPPKLTAKGLSTQPPELKKSLLPSPIITLDTLRKTPPTIMLHRSNEKFDSVQFLNDLIVILKEKQLKVITYQDISRQPDITALEEGRLFIITIDDVSLQAPIDPDIKKMITLLLDAGYPAVLGVITEGKLPDLETAARLKELSGRGWELAMHTDNHLNLHELEMESAYGARLEIRNCRDKILAATGVSADTLILPYGDNVADLKILYREHVVWTVGITGGNKYRTTNWTYYVGREGPDGNARTTFEIMWRRFNP